MGGRPPRIFLCARLRLCYSLAKGRQFQSLVHFKWTGPCLFSAQVLVAIDARYWVSVELFLQEKVLSKVQLPSSSPCHGLSADRLERGVAS